jgi:hypothetical protein
MPEAKKGPSHTARAYFLTPKAYVLLRGIPDPVTKETADRVFGKHPFWSVWFKAFHFGHKNLPGPRLINQ